MIPDTADVIKFFPKVRAFVAHVLRAVPNDLIVPTGSFNAFNNFVPTTLTKSLQVVTAFLIVSLNATNLLFTFPKELASLPPKVPAKVLATSLPLRITFQAVLKSVANLTMYNAPNAKPKASINGNSFSMATNTNLIAPAIKSNVIATVLIIAVPIQLLINHSTNLMASANTLHNIVPTRLIMSPITFKNA